MADPVITFDRGRYGLALSVARAPFALGGPNVLRHILEDMGFENVTVFDQGAALPPEAAPIVAGLTRVFPEWIAYAQASWPGSTKGLAPANETFEIVRAVRLDLLRVPQPTPREPSPTNAGAYLAAIVVLAFGASYAHAQRKMVIR